MSKYFKIIALAFLLSKSVDAQVTVHVLNPWRTDTCAGHRDSLLVEGFINGSPNNTWADRSMTPEGGNWFYFTYASSSNSFALVTHCGPWQDWVSYKNKYNFNIDSLLLRFPKGTNELWIAFADSILPPAISDKPSAGAKLIYFLSPWDVGGVRVMIKNTGAPKMKMDTSINRCGWFNYSYYGQTDSIKVKFMNFLDSTIYSSSGTGSGDYIDISTALKAADTAWVYPAPYPNGPPVVARQYPNISAICRKTLLLKATLRDIDTSHPDFGGFYPGLKNSQKTGCWHPGDWGAAIPGIVQNTLDNNGKPLLSPTSPCPVDSFNWFDTKYIYNKYPNAKCFNLKMTQNEDGLYTYDTAYFFAADDFRYLDSNNTVVNPWWGGGSSIIADTSSSGVITIDTTPHNYNFTMELSAQFEYTKGQTFYFRGDDDVWVFINNKLVVDDGGIHNPIEKSISLDTLGLTPGNTYPFKLFFCERNCCGSSFKMVTSLNLYTSSNLFTTQTLPGGSVRQYNMFENITQNSLSCDNSQNVIGTRPAVVDFYLSGPSFPQPTLLPVGTSHGGITIPSGNTIVSIDTAAMTGLLPGTYLISYFLRSDKSQTGTIAFTISSLPPDHFDILPDTVQYDQKKDAPVDTIVIGMFDSLARAYAVVRDVNGAYLKRASNPTWTSRNSLVATVIQSPTDPSSCIITKAGAGATWVVVSDPAGALKPDSIKIITFVLPKYPVIVSAVMLDTNADLIPDMLSITVNDTFKTNQRLDSIVIDYRGTTYSIPAANARVSGASIKVPFTPVTGVDGRPGGLATIAITTGDGPQTSTKVFTDGVDPAIIAASVMENDGGSPDTLFVTFSEPVLQSTVARNQLLLIKAGPADTVSIDILQVLPNSADSTFTLQVVSSSGQQPKAGDRLRLLPGSQGGAIADMNANKPHDLNRSVVLGFRAGPTPVVSAYYLDVNADGYLDRMIVGFKRPVQLPDVSVIITQWNIQPAFQYDTIAVNSVVKINDSLYSMPLHGSAIRPAQVRTGPAMEVDVQYGAFPGIIRSLPVADSAGPVLLDTAKLVYGNSPDSIFLIIPFSENVQRPGNHPFVAWSKKYGVPYQMDLTWISTNGNVDVFHVDAIEGGTVLNAGNGDSIWINTDSLPLVRDVSGFPQRDSLNHRVALHVTTQPPQWGVYISKNPFTPAEAGPEIAIVSESPIFDADQYSLKISIFDVIGNLVITMPMQPKGKGWACTWDGRNRNARFVGNGVYAAIIKIYKNNMENSTKRIRIGVKR